MGRAAWTDQTSSRRSVLICYNPIVVCGCLIQDQAGHDVHKQIERREMKGLNFIKEPEKQKGIFDYQKFPYEKNWLFLCVKVQ